MCHQFNHARKRSRRFRTTLAPIKTVCRGLETCLVRRNRRVTHREIARYTLDHMIFSQWRTYVHSAILGSCLDRKSISHVIYNTLKQDVSFHRETFFFKCDHSHDLFYRSFLCLQKVFSYFINWFSKGELCAFSLFMYRIPLSLSAYRKYIR